MLPKDYVIFFSILILSEWISVQISWLFNWISMKVYERETLDKKHIFRKYLIAKKFEASKALFTRDILTHNIAIKRY